MLKLTALFGKIQVISVERDFAPRNQHGYPLARLDGIGQHQRVDVSADLFCHMHDQIGKRTFIIVGGAGRKKQDGKKTKQSGKK